jgi:hypothetical protein
MANRPPISDAQFAPAPALPAFCGGGIVVVDGAVLTVGVVVVVTAAVVGGVVTFGDGVDGDGIEGDGADEVGVVVIGSEVAVVSGASCTRSGATDGSTGASSVSADTCGAGCVVATASVGRTGRFSSRVMSAPVTPPRVASATTSTAISFHARRALMAAVYPPQFDGNTQARCW